jgi:hypothetical protein
MSVDTWTHTRRICDIQNMIRYHGQIMTIWRLRAHCHSLKVFLLDQKNEENYYLDFKPCKGKLNNLPSFVSYNEPFLYLR